MGGMGGNMGGYMGGQGMGQGRYEKQCYTRGYGMNQGGWGGNNMGGGW